MSTSTNAPLMLSVSGLRGTFGGSLTPDTIARYASAIAGDVLAQRKPSKKRPIIAIGCDGRASSEDVYAIAAASLKLCGCDVVYLGVAMTPTVGFAVDALGADAGVQITASHNPQHWCGLKTISRDRAAKKKAVNASAPSKADADRIINRFRNGPITTAEWSNVGQPDLHPMGDDHAQHILNLLDGLDVLKLIRAQRFEVTLDTVGGSGAHQSPAFLKALGCRTLDLYPLDKFPGGHFPHTPEPTKENLKQLCSVARKAGTHVGFAQDPDADRLAIVDERGSYIGEEYTLVLAALAMGELGLLKKGSVIPVNLSTSRMIEDVARRYGCHVMRTAVGEANVVEAMKANKSPLGGEGNGGVIWPKVTYIRDSLSAMALTLALLARRKKPLSAVVAEVPSYAIVKRKVELAGSGIEPKAAVEAVAKAFNDRKPDRTDGAWINFEAERAWLHVRASNTEPILRLIAEAPTAAQANAILDQTAKLVK